MDIPNDETLKTYKDNLLGGHLLGPKNANVKSYWTGILESCAKTEDGSPDINHFKDMTHFNNVEVIIGLTHLKNAALAEQTDARKSSFLFSKNQILGIVAIGGAFVATAFFLKKNNKLAA